MHHQWLGGPYRCAALIGLASLAVYANSLVGEFIWDDIPQVRENPFIRELKNLPYFFTVDLGRYTAYPGFSPYYRPLFLASYTLDYMAWGLNPLGYHLTNTVLHALCSALVYAIALALLKESAAAFFAAAIFALHPVHVEAVAWIAGRADLLAAFFLFASFYTYVLFRKQRRKLFLGLSVLAYALSLFSKEASVALPLLLAAYELSLRPLDRHETTGEKLRWLPSYILIAALYFITRTIVMGSFMLANPDAPPMNLARLYAIPRITLEYFRLFLLPINLKVYYEVPLVGSVFDPAALFSIVLVSLILTGVRLARSRDRVSFFAFLWFFIAILPVLGRAGLALMADRYLYMPSLGLCLVAGRAFSKIDRPGGSRGRFSIPFAALPLILLSMITFQRNMIWKNEFGHFNREIEDAPNFPFGYNNLGKWYLDRKLYDQAIPLFQKATEVDPAYVYATVNVAYAYFQKGLIEEAISAYRKAIETKPGFAEAYYGLGVAYMQMGRMEEAIAQWQNTLRLKPEHSEANNNLGNVYLLQGRYREAAGRYAAALRGRPLNVEARYNLAMALEKQGDLKAALSHYKTFVELAPAKYQGQILEAKRKLERSGNAATSR